MRATLYFPLIDTFCLPLSYFNHIFLLLKKLLYKSHTDISMGIGFLGLVFSGCLEHWRHREKYRKENFQTEFVIAGGGFLSYWNHQQIKFEEERRFGLYKQICNYQTREMNTFENFPCDFFNCKISLCSLSRGYESKKIIKSVDQH